MNTTKSMKKYTIGIYFDKQLKRVVLILKNRPKWQAGKFNFPGGHIEEGETPEICIVREFGEECGIYSNIAMWRHIGVIRNGNEYECQILTAIDNGKDQLRTMEDQPVMWVDKDALPDNVISNLFWLVPFAFNYWKQGNADYLSFGYFNYQYEQPC